MEDVLRELWGEWFNLRDRTNALEQDGANRRDPVEMQLSVFKAGLLLAQITEGYDRSRGDIAPKRRFLPEVGQPAPSPE